MFVHGAVAPSVCLSHVSPGAIFFSSVHFTFLLFPLLSLSPILFFCVYFSPLLLFHPIILGPPWNSCQLPSLPLIQSEPSAAPEGVSCESASSTSLRVSWKPPPLEGQNGVLAGYELSYQRLSGTGAGAQGQEVKALPVPAQQRQTLVERLEKWSWYNITIAASTASGAGPSSLAVLCRTDEDGK